MATQNKSTIPKPTRRLEKYDAVCLLSFIKKAYLLQRSRILSADHFTVFYVLLSLHSLWWNLDGMNGGSRKVGSRE